MRYSKSEAKRLAELHGWNHKLGYSKRELGISTPKNPRRKNSLRRKARKKSGGRKTFFKSFKKLISSLIEK